MKATVTRRPGQASGEGRALLVPADHRSSGPADGPRRGSTITPAPTWRQLLRRAEARLTSSLDARRILERASGAEGAEWVLVLDQVGPARSRAHFDAMVERRAAGEPLQYVVGRWAFRTLDLMLDRRVLIPRPETELVVEIAIREARRLGPPRPLRAVDLGTGSGAVALSLAVELGAEVWGTDISPGALAVARANVAGTGGSPARRVRLAEGDWFGALPIELRGSTHLVVSNPPYVAEGDDLPAEVADWEPLDALIAGPTGLEDIERIVSEAPDWIPHPGALVVELAPAEAEPASALARQAGFDEVEIKLDLNALPRMLVARLV